MALHEAGDRHDRRPEGQVDIWTHGTDDAGDLLARSEGPGRRERVGVTAHEHVGQADARRGYPDTDLARAGLRNGDVGEDQNLRRLPWPVDSPRSH